MVDSDYPNAAAAFELFVRGDWHWPLGENPDFGGVNIFFSDASPWYALFSKALYQSTGFFPNFHFLILLNFILLSLMARRLCEKIFEDETSRWLGTVLIAFNLIMPVRIIGATHIALSSYWVVLWAMVAVPMGDENKSRLRRWEFLPSLGFAVWSHAYLGAMAVVLVAAMLLCKRRRGAFILSFLWPLALLWMIGAFQGTHATVQGAKDYSLDLLAFGESLNWGIPGNLYAISSPPQSDAILYLGTGVWLLACLALAGAGASRLLQGQNPFSDLYKPRLVVLTISSLLLVGYAMAFNLRIGGRLLASIDIPFFFDFLYERFRATGRFGAPLAFCLILWVVVGWGALGKKIPFWRTVMIAAVALQIADGIHAGKISPSSVQLADAANQRAAVASLLKDKLWSGRVFKDVGYYELEQQRLLDRLLVDYGASRFEVVHGARLDPEEVKRLSGFDAAKPDDVVIARADRAQHLLCRNCVQIKDFLLCLPQAANFSEIRFTAPQHPMDEDFLNWAYRDLLKREPDREGYAHYLAQMEKGTSREAVVESIRDSAEYKSLFEK